MEQENIPLERPSDYFVEMFKNDKIMGKIKGRLAEKDVITKKKYIYIFFFLLHLMFNKFQLKLQHQEERAFRL